VQHLLRQRINGLRLKTGAAD